MSVCHNFICNKLFWGAQKIWPYVFNPCFSGWVSNSHSIVLSLTPSSCTNFQLYSLNNFSSIGKKPVFCNLAIARDWLYFMWDGQVWKGEQKQCLGKNQNLVIKSFGMHWHKLYLYPTKLQNNLKCSPKFLASLAQEL